MKAYISCQLSTSASVRNEVMSKLTRLGYTPTIYIKDTAYSDKDLKEADIVVLIDQGVRYIENLTRGCRTEIQAVASEKPVYIVSHTNRIFLTDRDKLVKNKCLVNTGIHLEVCNAIKNTYQLY